MDQFVRKDITMDTDEDPEGRARAAEGKAGGKGAVLTPGSPHAWLPRGPADLTVHHTSVAGYTNGLSGDPCSPSLAPMFRGGAESLSHTSYF